MAGQVPYLLLGAALGVREVHVDSEHGSDANDVSSAGACSVGNTMGEPWGDLGIAARSRAPGITETSENLGKAMGHPCNGFGERLARGQGEARRLPGKEEREANAKVGRALGRHWNGLGGTPGKR
eukprot:gene12229-biopygen4325